MRHSNFSFFFLLLTAIGSGMTSCRKFVEIPPAKNTVTTSAVFTDSANATAAILGMYIGFMSSAGAGYPLNGLTTIYMGLAADELYATNQDISNQQFYQNSVSATNGYTGFWYLNYRVIYQANASIEGLAGSTGISKPAKDQLTGEAKLMRAICYFNMVNLFGDVPLVTGTNFEKNAIIPRTPKNTVYDQIIKDLKDAASVMSAVYITEGRVRPNKYAALALLSRVYLYRQQWPEAEAAASAVIDEGGYGLEPDLNNVFLAKSNEVIWQLLPVIPGYNSPEGNSFIPFDATLIPTYCISNYLLHAFEPGDQRKAKWLNSNIVNGQTYYYPYKYKLRKGGAGAPTEDYIVFRLGEQYLIRAEARAQQDNVTGANSAVSDLDAIRNRAGLSGTAAANKQDMLQAILHERQTEFFCEWGHRWYDLKRMGNVDAVMNVVTPAKGGTWSTNRQLLPVPYEELQKNAFLIQNPGYN